MASCIKTLLLSSLKTDLAGIPGVKSVTLNPVDLPKADEASKVAPFLVLIDYPETIEEKNREVRRSFELHVYACVHSDLAENLSSDMDDLAAKIYQLMVDNKSTYYTYCQRRMEISLNKDYIDENTGQLECVWKLTYHHCQNDPYSRNPTIP